MPCCGLRPLQLLVMQSATVASAEAAGVHSINYGGFNRRTGRPESAPLPHCGAGSCSERKSLGTSRHVLLRDCDGLPGAGLTGPPDDRGTAPRQRRSARRRCSRAREAIAGGSVRRVWEDPVGGATTHRRSAWSGPPCGQRRVPRAHRRHSALHFRHHRDRSRARARGSPPCRRGRRVLHRRWSDDLPVQRPARDRAAGVRSCLCRLESNTASVTMRLVRYGCSRFTRRRDSTAASVSPTDLARPRRATRHLRSSRAELVPRPLR
jgi:hypothetical protein